MNISQVHERHKNSMDEVSSGSSECSSSSWNDISILVSATDSSILTEGGLRRTPTHTSGLLEASQHDQTIRESLSLCMQKLTSQTKNMRVQKESHRMALSTLRSDFEQKLYAAQADYAETLERERSEAKDMCDSLRADLMNLRLDTSASSLALDHLRRENASLSDEVKRLRDELSAKVERITALEGRLKEFRVPFGPSNSSQSMEYPLLSSFWLNYTQSSFVNIPRLS